MESNKQNNKNALLFIICFIVSSEEESEMKENDGFISNVRMVVFGECLYLQNFTHQDVYLNCLDKKKHIKPMVN